MSRVDGTIERLDFVLPDFTRVSWVSDAARETWAPRLGRITKAWFEIEWRAVISNVRCCGVTVVSPEELITMSGEWVKHGLSALPLEIQAAHSSYSNTGRKALLVRRDVPVCHLGDCVGAVLQRVQTTGWD